jgi:hypothetical protein
MPFWLLLPLFLPEHYSNDIILKVWHSDCNSVNPHYFKLNVMKKQILRFIELLTFITELELIR